jgi:hypothetical protein
MFFNSIEQQMRDDQDYQLIYEWIFFKHNRTILTPVYYWDRGIYPIKSKIVGVQ